MRNPNGYGSVYKLSGNRRNPWAARKTTGKTEKGWPVYTFIGFYKSKREAADALAKFNANPYDKKTTFAMVYDAWARECLADLSENTQKSYTHAKRAVSGLFPMKLAEIRLEHLQPIFDRLHASSGKAAKSLLSNVFQYGVRHEIITPDRCQMLSFIRLSKDKGREVPRVVFTDEEIQHVTDPLVLILLYTGMRVGELLALQPEDVHLEERWFQVRQSKTAAGVRKVPIAEKIVPYMDAIPACVSYQTLLNRVAEYGHRPHDTRHTFISRMASLNPAVDERITKAIVGHAGSGITETVYTHIDLRPMLDAVNRL